MAKRHVYHWKHGWIPLTHTAAMSKAKGNREKAAELLAEAKSEHAGIHTREHVGKSALELTSIADANERAEALVDVQDAADRLGAVDALPAALRRSGGPAGISRVNAADVREGDVVHQPSAIGGRTRRLRVDKAHAPKSDGDVNVDATDLDTGRPVELTLPSFKSHDVERGKSTSAPKAAETALPGTSANPFVKTSISASEAKPGDSIILPSGGRMNVATVEPAPHGQVKITGTTGRAVTVSPRQAMSRFDGAATPEQPVDPFREGARQHVEAGKHKVGDAVSIRGQANSKVTIAEIKDGRARVQNAFESGAKGTWMPLNKLVPYGADTGRETPMGGRPVPGTGSTGSSIRRR